MIPTAKNKEPVPTGGFTLIELLLVILIIGVLTGVTLTVINSGGIRSKAHDAQRVSDIKKIQTALELYFADNRRYPISTWILVNSSSALATSLAPDYINVFPSDPLSTGSDSRACANPTNYRYNYETDVSGASYILTAIMEVSTTNDGFECNSLNNIMNGNVPNCSTWATADVCYGAENP